jgi:hypothetical protein
MNTARTTKIRQFLHSDPAEDAPDTFCCQRCDLFAPREHFDGCVTGAVLKNGVRYQETHAWSYVTARRSWLRNFERGDQRRIVDDPRNLFRTGTASE